MSEWKQPFTPVTDSLRDASGRLSLRAAWLLDHLLFLSERRERQALKAGLRPQPGVAEVSLATIADALGMHACENSTNEETVRTLLRTLHEKGLVTVQWPGRTGRPAHGKAPRYRIEIEAGLLVKNPPAGIADDDGYEWEPADLSGTDGRTEVGVDQAGHPDFARPNPDFIAEIGPARDRRPRNGAQLVQGRATLTATPTSVPAPTRHSPTPDLAASEGHVKGATGVTQADPRSQRAGRNRSRTTAAGP